MLLSALSVLAFVVRTFGVTVIPKSKKDIEIAVMRRSGLSKKSERLLQRSNRETLSLHLSPMAVGSVTPVVLAMMARVIIILVTTGQVVSRLSISVSTMPTGRWLKFLDNLQIIAKVC